jgi:hypothetical protein
LNLLQEITCLAWQRYYNLLYYFNPITMVLQLFLLMSMLIFLISMVASLNHVSAERRYINDALARHYRRNWQPGQNESNVAEEKSDAKL